jgi:hypothetical protein
MRKGSHWGGDMHNIRALAKGALFLKVSVSLLPNYR